MKFARRMTWRKLLIAFLLFFVAFLNLSRNAVHKTDQTFSQLYVTPQSESSVVSKTSSTSAVRNVTLQCEPERPCVYSDTVQLRVIVVTYNRPSSLLKLFECLDSLELDGHSAALEIWIDRQRRTDKVDERTVKVASEFQWSRGSTRVHVHTTHVGIYGQWIDTWRPHDDSNDELALILEDDLSISKYAYRWVRAVFRAYSQRADFAGASLTSHQMVILSARPKGRLAGPSNHTVMMYKCFGTWGFAPKPLHWRRFQDWYHTHKPSVMPTFHPYVPKALPSIWYRAFEASGRARHMWSIWFIYYMHTNQLYAVYSNLAVYTGDKESSLVINRLEAGLHYYHKRSVNTSRLLKVWKDEFAVCPSDPARLNWDGSYVLRGQRY